jgi:phosphoesterase RecJ-like protein
MSQPQTSDLPGPEFLDALQAVRRPLLLCHVTPDADAIGSALGLAMALRERGTDATLGLPDGCVAQKLEFMLDLAPDTPRAASWSENNPHDAVIVVDTAGEKRINIEPKPDLNGNILCFNIDHHVTNTLFGRHNWIDPHATSTCEMIVRLLARLDWTPSPAVASLLYAGIHSDTAGFSLPSTSAASLNCAADLVAGGADVARICELLCRSQAHNDFELLRRVFDNTKVVAGGRIAYSFLSHDDFRESGCKAETIDDQVGVPLGLKGVRLALLFTEGEKDVVRINLRGEGGVTVLELAKRFGGGGHVHAAGVRVRNQPIQKVIKDVVAAAIEHIDAFQEANAATR